MEAYYELTLVPDIYHFCFISLDAHVFHNIDIQQKKKYILITR